MGGWDGFGRVSVAASEEKGDNMTLVEQLTTIKRVFESMPHYYLSLQPQIQKVMESNSCPYYNSHAPHFQSMALSFHPRGLNPDIAMMVQGNSRVEEGRGNTINSNRRPPPIN